MQMAIGNGSGGGNADLDGADAAGYSGWNEFARELSPGFAYVGSVRSDGQPFGYGCGTASTDILIPDHIGSVDLLPACVAHDVCYDRGTTTSRADCDQALGAQITAACVASGYPAMVCSVLGAAYQSGVHAFGAGAYDQPLVPPVEAPQPSIDWFLYY